MKLVKPWRELNERVFNFRYPARLADLRWRDFPKKFVIDFGLLGIGYLAFILVTLLPWQDRENAIAAVKIFTVTFLVVSVFDLGTVALVKLYATLKRKS